MRVAPRHGAAHVTERGFVTYTHAFRPVSTFVRFGFPFDMLNHLRLS